MRIVNTFYDYLIKLNGDQGRVLNKGGEWESACAIVLIVFIGTPCKITPNGISFLL